MTKFYSFKIVILAILLAGFQIAYGQVKIGINESTIQSGSLLELETTNKGLLLPRLTGAQMNAIPVTSASRGMLVFNTDSQCICEYRGASVNRWHSLCAGHPDSLGGNGKIWPYHTNDKRVGNNGNGGGIISLPGIGLSATGLFSHAEGHTNTASGKYSWAVGFNNTASGQLATSWGTLNAASGIGNGAYAIGYQNTASGDRAFALGSGNTVGGIESSALGNDNTVNGNFAFAGGGTNTVSGTGAVALGTNNISSGFRSFAAGFLNYSSNQTCVALGYQDSAVGLNAFAMGYQTKASGDYAAVFGRQSTASGEYAFSAGFLSKASGGSSFNLGYQNTASGTYSGTFGVLNTASGTGQGAWAIGSQCVASGDRSLAIGAGVTASGTRSMVAGFVGGYTFYTDAANTVGAILASGGSSWAPISDIRAKRNIVTCGYGLNAVMALRPAIYNYVGQKDLTLGFIAQEVQKVVPEVIVQTTMGPTNDYLAVKYTELIPVLTKAIQEQQVIIDQLQKRITDLENK